MRPAEIRATNRRALLAFTGVLAALMIAVALVLVWVQRAQLAGEEREELETELLLLGELATDALLQHDYDAVEGLVKRWLDRHDYLHAIRAVAPNGFVLAELSRAGTAADPMLAKHEVVFRGQRLLSLHAVGDFADKRRAFVVAAAQVAAATLVLIALLSAALWYTLKRTALQPLEGEIESRERTEQELLQRNVELQAARDEAERASRAKSEFLSRMSHELRTPLNAIIGFAQLVRIHPTIRADAEQAEHVAHIEKAGWHLLALINEVLDLSRIESGTMTVVREQVALQALCEECVQLVRPLAQEAGVEVIQRFREAEPLFAWGDCTRLSQVLMNLLSNAVKYNRRGGSVTVELALGNDHVEIGVTDTGPGFTEQQRRQLFQPFNRLGAEAGRTQGTGIGLVIARRLTELMGGTLELGTTSGAGSCFVVRLARSQAPEPSPGTAAARPAMAPEPAPAARRVLYVEDNPSNLALVEAALSLRPGIRLLHAGDGASGLALAAAEQPDLILLDIALPGIDGHEVCRRLRADPATRTVPIVALSGNAMDSDLEQGRRAGFDAYLTKPLDMALFLAEVDRRLGATAVSATRG